MKFYSFNLALVSFCVARSLEAMFMSILFILVLAVFSSIAGGFGYASPQIKETAAVMIASEPWKCAAIYTVTGDAVGARNSYSEVFEGADEWDARQKMYLLIQAKHLKSLIFIIDSSCVPVNFS